MTDEKVIENAPVYDDAALAAEYAAKRQQQIEEDHRRSADSGNDKRSDHRLFRDTFLLIPQSGLCGKEYSQRTQNKAVSG